MQGGSQQPLGDMKWRRLGPTVFISSFYELMPWHGVRCPSVYLYLWTFCTNHFSVASG